MITNERQYKITRAEAMKLRNALEAAIEGAPAEGVHPRIHQAMQDGLRSQLNELDATVRDYEELRAGRVRERTFYDLNGLLTALIEARIAGGLTQRELGERLNLAEQQIQRYEATGYAGVSIDRIQEIADTLQLQVEERVTYAVPAEGAARAE
jgi:ribosome-binding protein aMBF1 (putative translation factor)